MEKERKELNLQSNLTRKHCLMVRWPAPLQWCWADLKLWAHPPQVFYNFDQCGQLEKRDKKAEKVNLSFQILLLTRVAEVDERHSDSLPLQVSA